MSDENENIPGRHRFSDLELSDPVPLTRMEAPAVWSVILSIVGFWLVIGILIARAW